MKKIIIVSFFISTCFLQSYSQKPSIPEKLDARLAGIWVLNLETSNLGHWEPFFKNRILQISVKDLEITVVTTEEVTGRLISKIVLYADDRGETNIVYARDPTRLLTSKTKLKKGILIRKYTTQIKSNDLSSEKQFNVTERYAVSIDGDALTITQESPTLSAQTGFGPMGPDSLETVTRTYKRFVQH